MKHFTNGQLLALSHRLPRAEADVVVLSDDGDDAVRVTAVVEEFAFVRKPCCQNS